MPNLSLRIQEASKTADVDEEWLESANLTLPIAVAYAKKFLEDATPDSVYVTEEGAVALRWGTLKKGVMIIFTQDQDSAVYSIKSDRNDLFSWSGIGFSLNESLPEVVKTAIEGLK